MRDLGLLLEDRAHQLRQVRGRCRRPPGTRRGSAPRARSRSAASCAGSSSSRSSVASTSSGRVARVEAEARARRPRGRRSIVGVIRRPRKSAAAAPRAREQRRRDVLVDRRGELLGELLLGRRRMQVDLRDEHAVAATSSLRGPPDERRLAVAARREDDDVLAVADVGRSARAISASRSVKASSRARAPKRKGLA